MKNRLRTSLFFSPMSIVAGCAMTQSVRLSKVLAADDIPLCQEAEVRAAKREEARLSSYKLLQALSHQLLLQTQLLTLTSLDPPTNQPITQTTNKPITQSLHQLVNHQSTSQSPNQQIRLNQSNSASLNESRSQPTNQSANQPINQPIIHSTT